MARAFKCYRCNRASVWRNNPTEDLQGLCAGCSQRLLNMIKAIKEYDSQYQQSEAPDLGTRPGFFIATIVGSKAHPTTEPSPLVIPDGPVEDLT